LNLGKTGDLYKTNPSQLRRVSPPPLTTRKTKRQTGETNRVQVRAKRAAGNRLTYEKELPNPKKTITFSKRITPASPHALPSRQGKDVMMAFDFAGKAMRVEHNSAQNSLREEFQGHHPNQAYYKSGIMPPGQ